MVVVLEYFFVCVLCVFYRCRFKVIDPQLLVLLEDEASDRVSE